MTNPEQTPGFKVLVSEMKALRSNRKFNALIDKAEEGLRNYPDNPTVSRLLAQGLIDSGKSSIAIPLLESARTALEAVHAGASCQRHTEYPELTGLIGRANKQLFCDAACKSDPLPKQRLARAFREYEKGYEIDEQSADWHGVNMLAIMNIAKEMRIDLETNRESTKLAESILNDLQGRSKLEAWHHASMAEASIALERWSDATEHLNRYFLESDLDAFMVYGTYRQFRDMWKLDEKGGEASEIILSLKAEIARVDERLEISDPAVTGFSVDEVRTLKEIFARSASTRWSSNPGAITHLIGALVQVPSIAIIRDVDNSRLATGFVVSLDHFGAKSDTAEYGLLTNYHVINEAGAGDLAMTPKQASIEFPERQTENIFEVGKILWSSKENKLDAVLLELMPPLNSEKFSALELAHTLPDVNAHNPTRAMLVGCTGKARLKVELNEQILDHEGPPDGEPNDPTSVRIHYAGRSVQGHSGGPLIDLKSMTVIGMHRRGSHSGAIARLNGQTGSYSENETIGEAISIESIATACRKELSRS